MTVATFDTEQRKEILAEQMGTSKILLISYYLIWDVNMLLLFSKCHWNVLHTDVYAPSKVIYRKQWVQPKAEIQAVRLERMAAARLLEPQMKLLNFIWRHQEAVEILFFPFLFFKQGIWCTTIPKLVEAGEIQGYSWDSIARIYHRLTSSHGIRKWRSQVRTWGKTVVCGPRKWG